MEKVSKILRRQSTPISSFFIGLLLSLLVFLTGTIINLMANSKALSIYQSVALAVPSLLAGLFVWLIKIVEDIAFVGNMKNVVELPYNEEGFLQIGSWFKKVFRIRPQLYFCIGFGVLSVITSYFLLLDFPELHKNLGLYFCIFIAFSSIGDGAYAALFIPTMVKVASETRLNLYPYDPIRSKAVSVANQAFGSITLGTGLVATIVMILLFVIHPWGEIKTFWIAMGWLVIVWGVTTYSFVYPHYFISKGILFEKRIQLESLDNQIYRLTSKIGKNITLEEIGILEKYILLREKIYSANNSSIDIAAFRNYLTSLILPSVSFGIGAIETIKKII
jgi:hypothetical protein